MVGVDLKKDCFFLGQLYVVSFIKSSILRFKLCFSSINLVYVLKNVETTSMASKTNKNVKTIFHLYCENWRKSRANGKGSVESHPVTKHGYLAIINKLRK